MKKVLLVALVGVLFVAVAASGQTIVSKDQLTRSDLLLKIPFKPPPPPIYQVVPNEAVVQLAADMTRMSVDAWSGTIVTGCPTLDELNKKYEVKSFVRQFPDCRTKARTAAAECGLSRYYIMKFGAKVEVEEVVKAYSACADVERAEPIGIHPVVATPNDTYFANQWGWYNTADHDIDATDAWDYHTGSPGAIVAALETGVQYTHRDLGGSAPYTDGNVWINQAEYGGAPGVDDDGNGYIDDWIGWDFVSGVSPLWPGEDGSTPDNEPTDFNGHGTHVSGTMAAMTNNGYGVAGLAGGWGDNPGNGIKVMAVRIGWSAPYMGYEVGYVRMDFAAQGIYYAVNNGAVALNCSWGSSNSGGLGAAVDYATAHGVVVVEAAGNDGVGSSAYLGSRADVVSVCAVNSADVKPYWSNYGSWVDIAAPGVSILSTYSNHYTPAFAYSDGTSMAAPHVTGAAGFLKSYADSLTRDQIVDLLLTYTDDIDHLNPSYAGLMGSGRLNIFKALDAVGVPAVTVIQPNGGEVLYIGQVYTVMWDATDNVGIVRTTVEYSHDGGANWGLIADLAGNPGEYDWTVTGPPSDQCRMQVTCYDAVDRSSSDMSDEDFCPPYKVASMAFAVAGDFVVPDEFALLQNYPNPFNPATKIDFSLREECDVTLNVYNVLGRKVAALIDTRMPAGEHSVFWDARALGSGVYFYRLEAGDFVDTKQMMMLK